MFGNTISISCNGLTIVLRPGRESDIEKMTIGMSDWEVKKYLGGVGGCTEEGERNWFKKVAESNSSVEWVIQPEGVDYAIGSTGLRGIDNPSNTCVSGCAIWDKSWWGKGIASLAHIARTWFAAKQLNRYTIVSQIYSPNCGSWRAVEKVGYIRTGVELRVRIADGKYVDKYIYTWLNPYVLPILFPDGVPQEYVLSIGKAKETLDKGDEYIKYI